MDALSHSARNSPLAPKARQFTRKPVLFASIQVGEDATGFILNISERGLCVQTAQEIPADQPVRMRFQSLQSRDWVEAQGRIVWKNEEKNITGIEFVDLAAEAQREVRTWLSFGDSLQELRGNWPAEGVREEAGSESGIEGDIASGVESDSEGDIDPLDVAARHQEDTESATLSEWPPLAGDLDSAPDAATIFREEQPARPADMRPRPGIAAVALALALVFLAIWAGQHAGIVQRVEGFFSKKIVAPVPTGPSNLSVPAAEPAPPPVLSPSQALAAAARKESPASAPSAHAVAAASRSPKAEGDSQFALQVAAMREEENAKHLAEELRSKNFPVSVSKRNNEHLYKVIVGPYADIPSVRSAEEALKKEGITPIAKRWTP
jgi:cell division septation protein DedD